MDDKEEYKKSVLFFVGQIGMGREIPESTIQSWAEMPLEVRPDTFMVVDNYFKDLDKNQSTTTATPETVL